MLNQVQHDVVQHDGIQHDLITERGWDYEILKQVQDDGMPDQVRHDGERVEGSCRSNEGRGDG